VTLSYRSPARLAGADVDGSGAAGRLGAVGLPATVVSFVLTCTVALLGPSLMEPALPGAAGQPPRSVGPHPSPYLAVALGGAAILAAVIGLTFSLNAINRGWSVPARPVLIAGIAGAVLLALLPPFGSSDHLSYAAYGRMAITGHNPFTTTPAELARIGDPVARAVQDWRRSPSVYGPLAVAGQAFAAWVGGTSVRLIVFVLSLVNVLAFALTGLVLHWLGRGDAVAQRRAAIGWTANPLMLMILVAGAHVDTQAIVFAVGAVAVAVTGLRAESRRGQALRFAGAGALIGLGFAIKVTTALVGAGIAIGLMLAAEQMGWMAASTPENGAQLRDPSLSSLPPPPPPPSSAPPSPRAPSPLRWIPQFIWQMGCELRNSSLAVKAALAGLAGGFCVVTAFALIPWGTGMFGPALRAGSFTSVGSPWRAVRSGLRLLIGENPAENVVKAGALLLGVVLLPLLIGYFRRADGGWQTDRGPWAEGPGRRAAEPLVAVGAFAVIFAWLLAWPYVLPWYDGLGWALLVMLPASRLDWLMLARTAALAIGYLPARGIALPAGLGWLETVVRTAITPLVLLAVLVLTVSWLWPKRRIKLVTP
jgi:hypothetical protein